jgi:hypothetical protein
MTTKERMTEARNAYDLLGIPHDWSGRILQQATEAGRLAALITQKTATQAAYDIFQNIPCGVLSASEPPRSSLRAIPCAVGEWLNWDINSALNLCADILDDVNAHAESAILRAMIEEVQS